MMVRIDIWTGARSQTLSASHHMDEDDPQLLPLIKRELRSGSLVNLLLKNPDAAAIDHARFTA